MSKGNFVSEWFGHRLFPEVRAGSLNLSDLREARCPFLSAVRGRDEPCVKSEPSQGVCTISAESNGPRQDWVVCPYRIFDSGILERVATDLFGPARGRLIVPAPILAEESVRDSVMAALDGGDSVLVYFDQKLGGEIQISATESSPQIAFDVTLVELEAGSSTPTLGRFGVLEIQTMDFHGSYRRAVANLRDGLRLHRAAFPSVLRENKHWLSDGIEGPNIANVFKRTFYQLMFKFELTQSSDCAGVALTLPVAVWESWRKFLGAPEVIRDPNGVSRISDSAGSRTGEQADALIYLFDLDFQSDSSPSPVTIEDVIHTSADVLARQAFDVAPSSMVENLHNELYPTLVRRLRRFWPIDFGVAE